MISEKTDTKKEKSHFSWSAFPKLIPYNNVKNPATELTKAHTNQPMYRTQRGQYFTSSRLGSLEAGTFVAVNVTVDGVPTVSSISSSFPFTKLKKKVQIVVTTNTLTYFRACFFFFLLPREIY